MLNKFKNINFKVLLIIVSILQVFILLGMLVSANLPLYYGEEIKVKTIPIDPRSLFRGNFVRLGYNFNTIKTNKKFDKGEKIYISLKEKDGFMVKDEIFKKPPPERYIQCRVEYSYKNSDKEDKELIKYKITTKCANINAFFTNPEKALKLEKNLREGGATAIIMLYNGKMALKDIVPVEKE